MSGSLDAYPSPGLPFLRGSTNTQIYIYIYARGSGLLVFLFYFCSKDIFTPCVVTGNPRHIVSGVYIFLRVPYACLARIHRRDENGLLRLPALWNSNPSKSHSKRAVLPARSRAPKWFIVRDDEDDDDEHEHEHEDDDDDDDRCVLGLGSYRLRDSATRRTLPVGLGGDHAHVRTSGRHV